MAIVLIFLGVSAITLLIAKVNNDQIKKEYNDLFLKLKKDPKNRDLLEQIYIVGRKHYDGQTIKGLFKRREKYYVVKKDANIKADIEKCIGKVK